jgi:alkylation response protein AidB-like acyl-CoA dehydrogenase
MAQEGFVTLCIPQEHGGNGLDVLTAAIVLEELAAGDGGIAFTAGLCSVHPIQLFGNQEQKRKFLPPLCDRNEPKLSAFALTEPAAGSDAATIQATAKLEGDEYVINGAKCFISNGGIASLYTILASTDKSKGVRGISAFIVPGDTKGLSGGRVEDKMGFRTSQTAGIILNNVPVPKENLLGQEGKGFRLALEILNIWRVLNVGAIGVGIARAAYEAALNFAKHRIKLSSSHQQIVSFALADMLALIESGRLLTWKSCWMIDNNMPVAAQASMTKFLCSDMAIKVATEAVQILGIHAYTREYPVEKYMRDAKVLQIYEGTNQIQRVVVAGQLA